VCPQRIKPSTRPATFYVFVWGWKILDDFICDNYGNTSGKIPLWIPIFFNNAPRYYNDEIFCAPDERILSFFCSLLVSVKIFTRLTCGKFWIENSDRNSSGLFSFNGWFMARSTWDGNHNGWLYGWVIEEPSELCRSSRKTAH